MPGGEATGFAVVDPDGTVKIHVISDPKGQWRRRRVYRVRERTSPEDDTTMGSLVLDLLRDDGALEF
jgi:hypothetical protein